MSISRIDRLDSRWFEIIAEMRVLMFVSPKTHDSLICTIYVRFTFFFYLPADGRTSERAMDGQADEWTSGRTDGWTGGRADGRTDGRTGGRADGRTGG